MEHRHPGLRAYGPLSALAVLACALFLGSLLIGAGRIDSAERHREGALMRKDVTRRVHEVESMLNPFITWDEATERLDRFDANRAPDRAWAFNNIALSTMHSPLFEQAVAADYADRPIYGTDKSGQKPAAAFSDLMAVARPLIARVRAVEADPRKGAPGDHTPRASRIALVDGRPSLVSVLAVQADSGRRPTHGRHPLFVVQAPVDVALRAALADRHLLVGMRSDVGAGPVASGRTGVDLARTADGRSIRLTWVPLRPGAELLGRSVPFLVLAALILSGSAFALIRHARAISMRLVRNQEEARRLALHDPLTGLANRLLLGERLKQAREALRRGSGRLSVLYLDLDRFKEVNDTYGHQTGDELIREVGRRLQAVCRAEDTVARLGGDEFAVVSAAAEAVGAASLAERVVGALSGSVELTAGPVVLSCSVGVAVVCDPEIDHEETLRQADVALYRAKEGGRGRYCFFEPEMDHVLKARKALEHDLRDMLATSGPDVLYQPLVDADGRMFGTEALARWTRPGRGPVPPATFIKLAEECGLIGPLSNHVFRRACVDAARWPGLRTAVNLSPVQLRAPGFLSRVEAALAETGGDPTRMDLDITETCLIGDDRQTHEALASLRRMGFQLALDDFGTGYYSLSHLHRYPVQKLKLDRAFTARLSVGPEARAIVAAVIGMATALDLGVVAEGVETPEQFDMLRELGCREFQGFLFARPMDAPTLDGLVARDACLAPVPERRPATELGYEQAA